LSFECHFWGNQEVSSRVKTLCHSNNFTLIATFLTLQLGISLYNPGLFLPSEISQSLLYDGQTFCNFVFKLTCSEKQISQFTA